MRNIYSILLLVFALHMLAQTPQGFNYSAVARDAAGKPLANKNIKVQISILKGNANGAVQYTETHLVNSDVYGLFNLVVGNGTVVTGTLSNVPWGADNYFLKTAIDANGGTNFLTMGTTQLLSVPYALHSKKSDNGIDRVSANGDTMVLANGQNFVKSNSSGLQNGTTLGEMLYWNGTQWTNLNPGTNGQSLIICNGIPTWATNGICPGRISSIDCINITITGKLNANSEANGVSVNIPYLGGNGEHYDSQTFNSSGVNGLVAELRSGSFAVGSGNLNLTISGTPLTSDTAKFALNIGGQICTLSLFVDLPFGTISSINCPSYNQSGILKEAINANGVSVSISYFGGNGYDYNGQTILSSPDIGLSAILSSGTFANGNGILNFNIVGTPTVSGSAYFYFEIGGQSCGISLNILPVNNNNLFNQSLIYDSIYDIIGNSYKTVQIGSQFWMAENLRTTKYNDGTDITMIENDNTWLNLNTPAYCWLFNDSITNTLNKYGAIYNWFSINQSTNGNKNICPTGWHIPSDAEWTTLTNHLGGENIAGNKMKSLMYWISPSGATNESGFAALPGGERMNGQFLNGVGNQGVWWSNTENDINTSKFRSINYGSTNVNVGYYHKNGGMSVRCIKD